MKKALQPVIFGNTDADVTFISFGSLKGVIREAVATLIKKGKKVKHMHVAWVYPIPESFGEMLSREKRLICVEQNATGQLASVIKEATGITIKEKWLKYDGRQWTVEEIIEKYGR